MQLILVFTEDSTTGNIQISGVADNQNSANDIAANSLSRGRYLSAYTDKYTISTNITDELYIVYAIEGDDIDNIISFTGDKPSALDVKIYKSESSASKKADTYIADIGGNTNKYSAVSLNAYLNEPIIIDNVEWSDDQDNE